MFVEVVFLEILLFNFKINYHETFILFRVLDAVVGRV